MNIWLYYANAGGGHKSASQAIAQEFSRRYSNEVTVRFVNITDGSPAWVKHLIEQGYEFLINRAHWLWCFLYFISGARLIMTIENKLFSLTAKKYFINELKNNKPNKIVAMYFLLGPLMAALKKLKLNIPVVVVVTDPFIAHPIWFYYPNLNYIVGSERVMRRAIRAGALEENIKVLPQIINNTFLGDINEYDVKAFKKIYGLPFNKKIVLIVGGGNGLPHGKKILENLLASNLNAYFVMVCGHNKRLRGQVEKIAASHNNVKTLGFENFLHELTATADVVITKGGPGVVMETIALKKPLIITNYIWEQEKGNVAFVTQNGLGFYEPDLDKVPGRVSEVLFDETVKNRLEKNFERVKVKNGVGVTADYIYKNL